MSRLVRTGAGALVLVLIMFLGSLVLWVGIPLGWLYVGSQVQGATGSLGGALAVMFAGVIVSIAAVVALLLWLNRKHLELREARGLEPSSAVLEGVMGTSATIAVVGFVIWFFFFSGSSPIPFSPE